MEDGLHSGEHNIQFTEKRWYEAVLDFFRFLPAEAPTFATLVVTLWALAEVIMAAAGNRAPVVTFAISVLVIAAMVTGLRAYGRFKNYVPTALQSEAVQVQQIFRKQRCGWQLALTRLMLNNRISSAEIELDRVIRGAAFIPPQQLKSPEYFSWLTSRPEAIQRLVHSVAVLCTQDLPGVVAGVRDEGGLARLKVEVDALAALYSHAKDFEIECHEIVPPEPFEDAHKMTHGWTQTIRSGVAEFLTILDKLASLDAKALQAGTIEPPSFNITFDAPDNLDEFSRRLELVEVSAVLDH